MKNNPESLSKSKKKRSTVLLTVTTLFGILYLIFIIDYFIFEPQNLESIIVNLAFIIFLVGYYYSWRNKMIAGIIFIIWWGIMWYLGLFIAEQDRGAGVVMGVPIFIMGILFIVSWYRKRGRLGHFNNVNNSEKLKS